MELTVVERNGWKKLSKFDKAVVRIGSATANDIQLPAPEIAPVHLQVIHDPENPGSCKVLNLGPSVSFLSGGKDSLLETGAQAEARDCDEVILGEYHILFTLPLASKMMRASMQIGASLSVADAVLRPGAPATIYLKLKNLGAHPNCPFQVHVDGLPPECFRIDPLPILYPGAEEDVRIQFFHHGTTPDAGYHSITVTVSAPTSYPGEQVVLQQELYVDPLLAAGIRLVDDMPVPKVEAASMPASSEGSVPTADRQSPEPEMEPLSSYAIETAMPAIPAAKENPSPKVVRNPSETYWDEPS